MKRKKIRAIVGALALVLTVSMSGCSVTVNLGNKKEAAEGTETVEKKEETKSEIKNETRSEKKAETTKKAETPTPEPTATPVPVSEEKTRQTAPAAVQQSSTQTQYTTYYVVNCHESITLRPQPDVNSGEITQIPLGAAVSYVETAQNGFYKVIYNGNTGYALASYLSTAKQATSAVTAPVQSSAENYETYYVVNCNESITLRPQPDVNSGEICQIPLGSAVSYISAASNGFYYICFNGNTGYSLAAYLSPSSGGASYYSTCRVVNCNESITLRPQPDVDSGEICQIPLGETVSYIGPASNGFYEISYMGQTGYSLAEYLAFEQLSFMKKCYINTVYKYASQIIWGAYFYVMGKYPTQ